MPDNVNRAMEACPFCGSDNIKPDLSGKFMGCKDCLAESISGNWNNRPGEDAARQEQFDRDCKARPNDMAGFDHSDYERGFTDGVNDYEKAIRQVWKERHNRKEEHGI